MSSLGIKLVSSGLLLLGVGSVPTVAHAADATPTTSTATINVVKSSETGDLKLVSVPSFTFSKSLDSANTQLTDNNVSPNLEVDDETHTASGWNVTAQLGQFTDSDGKDVSDGNGWSMGLTPDTPAFTAKTTQTAQVGGNPSVIGQTLAPGKAAATVETADSGAGLGDWQTHMSSAKLNITSLPAKVATYTATITWTLSSGPTSDVSTN